MAGRDAGTSPWSSEDADYSGSWHEVDAVARRLDRSPEDERPNGRTEPRRSTPPPSRDQGPAARADRHALASRAPVRRIEVDVDLVRRFVSVVRRAPVHSAQDFVEDLLDQGLALEQVYTDLVTPAARTLGAQWEDDRCDYFEVTLAVGVLQELLRWLGPRFHIEDRIDVSVSKRVYLTALPGEQHTLGLAMIADFFARSGWGVAMGAPFEVTDPLAVLGREHFDVMGFSVSCDDSVRDVRDCIGRARARSLNPALVVVVGGRVIDSDPRCAGAIGADSGASDGTGAVAVADALT